MPMGPWKLFIEDRKIKKITVTVFTDIGQADSAVKSLLGNDVPFVCYEGNQYYDYHKMDVINEAMKNGLGGIRYE